MTQLHTYMGECVLLVAKSQGQHKCHWRARYGNTLLALVQLALMQLALCGKVQGAFDCCVGHSNGAHADPMQLALCGGVRFIHVHSGASSLQQQHGTTSASLLLLSVLVCHCVVLELPSHARGTLCGWLRRCRHD